MWTNSGLRYKRLILRKKYNNAYFQVIILEIIVMYVIVSIIFDLFLPYSAKTASHFPPLKPYMAPTQLKEVKIQMTFIPNSILTL